VAGVHHVDLVVSSLERSLPFYRDLLAPLGYTSIGEIVGERGEPVFCLGGTGAGSIGLREAQAPGDYERYRLGLHHLALAADSRELVDDRHRWLVDRGAEIENEPREYTDMRGDYATFFYDPDGIKLEIVHAPSRAS